MVSLPFRGSRPLVSLKTLLFRKDYIADREGTCVALKWIDLINASIRLDLRLVLGLRSKTKPKIVVFEPGRCCTLFLMHIPNVITFAHGVFC